MKRGIEVIAEMDENIILEIELDATSEEDFYFTSCTIAIFDGQGNFLFRDMINQPLKSLELNTHLMSFVKYELKRIFENTEETEKEIKADSLYESKKLEVV